jgi:hypothetical protein
MKVIQDRKVCLNKSEIKASLSKNDFTALGWWDIAEYHVKYILADRKRDFQDR